MRGREAWQLRLQSAAITIAVIAAGGVVQFYLAQAGEGERLRRLAYEVCSCCLFLFPPVVLLHPASVGCCGSCGRLPEWHASSKDKVLAGTNAITDPGDVHRASELRHACWPVHIVSCLLTLAFGVSCCTRGSIACLRTLNQGNVADLLGFSSVNHAAWVLQLTLGSSPAAPGGFGAPFVWHKLSSRQGPTTLREVRNDVCPWSSSKWLVSLLALGTCPQTHQSSRVDCKDATP